MRRRQGRVNRWVLVALAVLSLSLFFVVTRSVRMVKSRLYEEKLASARLSEQAFRVVREMRLQLGFPIDSVNDPNVSGLVGQQYSQTSYGRGDLSDELTTIDPNFSAAIVEMLHRAGVRRGDSIGVSWDGSYPALNIQLLAVAKTMSLRPVIVTAQSATAWGADYPGFTWLDIERRLAGSGLWTYRSKCATLGGADDLGQGLSPAGRAILTAAAESAGVELCPRLPDSTVRENGIRAGVALRVAAFAGVKAFVSIGKSVADIGDPLAKVPSRAMSGRIDSRGKSGVVGAMLQRGVPVVRIGNPSQVAIDYHLPLSPVPMPEPGKGRLFHERRYSVVLSSVFAAILLGLLALVVRYDVEWYLGVREDIGGKEAV